MARKLTTGWPFAADRHLIELAASKTLEQIADIMERPTISVRRRATRLGLTIKSLSPKAPRKVTGRTLSKKRGAVGLSSHVLTAKERRAMRLPPPRSF